jgi:hypothetical protein
MLPRRSSIAFIAGVLLCAAMLMFWARSYFFADSIFYSSANPHFAAEFSSEEGSFGFEVSTFSNALLPTGLNWTSSYRFQMFRYTLIQSLFDFEYHDYSLSSRRFSGPLHVRHLTLPQWTILFVAAIFPGWIFFRYDEKKARWKFRTDVAWRSQRLRARILRFALFSITGIILGTVVAWADIKTQFTENQSGWLLVLLALLPVASLMAVFTRRRIPWHRAILWMALELAGCVCFFESTLDYIWRHNHINRFDDVEILQMILYMGSSASSSALSCSCFCR